MRFAIRACWIQLEHPIHGGDPHAMRSVSQKSVYRRHSLLFSDQRMWDRSWSGSPPCYPSRSLRRRSPQRSGARDMHARRMPDFRDVALGWNPAQPRIGANPQSSLVIARHCPNEVVAQPVVLGVSLPAILANPAQQARGLQRPSRSSPRGRQTVPVFQTARDHCALSPSASGPSPTAPAPIPVR